MTENNDHSIGLLFLQYKNSWHFTNFKLQFAERKLVIFQLNQLLPLKIVINYYV